MFERLRSALPDLIPHEDKELVRLLRVAKHAQRYPATDTKRGRPGKWKRENLLHVVARLGDILDRETSSQISFASFADHYLRLLDFPPDVVEALENGYINLFEAERSRVSSPDGSGPHPAERSAHAPHSSPLICKQRLRAAASGNESTNFFALPRPNRVKQTPNWPPSQRI